MKTAALVPAAGRGSRLGHAQSKALVPVDGIPMVVRAVRSLVDSHRVDLVIVAAPPTECTAMMRLFPEGKDAPIIVPGGVSRQASVAAALAACPAAIEAVLVHDAARCFTPPSLIRRVVDALADSAAVVPVLPVPDTLRRGAIAGQQRVSAGVVDRVGVWRVQTPQGFHRDLFDRAYAAAAHRSDDEQVAATDDAALIEELGEPVLMIDGDDRALKITTPHDLALAHLLASTSPAGAVPTDVTASTAQPTGGEIGRA